MPCEQKCYKLALLSALLCAASLLCALVPPVPGYKNIPSGWQNTRVESSAFVSPKGAANTKVIPDSILVLRVQFSDKSFVSQAVYPDYLPHDEVFVKRWMLHLQDFYVDASHGAYKMNYSLYPQVLTMPNPMSYYGEDSSEKIDHRLPQMLPHIMAQIDATVDFSQYGGLIIFHAGAGQESDIDGIRTDEIWSTFMTRKNLQAAFEPDNDSYPGYPTNDGAVLTNVVMVPEDEFQDYFPAEGEENASAYLFSIYGVLAHQYGHLIGLPTLFDNDSGASGNDKSQGIGNWGLMGTGVWNGNGFVPAQLSAYSRYLLGWENPVVITQNSAGNIVDHFLNHSSSALRLYKIPITATEYFLIENRQQNPDASLDPYSSQPSYSFKLLPEGEQDYYENFPLLPYFNFMENSYLGSEWDFFLPGLGGPMPNNSGVLQDGSGLLIWHID
ncbi:MAG: M6 family metalloprotease domain-containing protein, partial [Candidatus Cloacimonas sp.]|nr:M6 family metalloprotease domain-containing protein [Candidatus Cloacimonas sp.]